MALLKAGADFDKKDLNGQLALDLAPDREVSSLFLALCYCTLAHIAMLSQSQADSLATIGQEIHPQNGRERRYRSMIVDGGGRRSLC